MNSISKKTIKSWKKDSLKTFHCLLPNTVFLKAFHSLIFQKTIIKKRQSSDLKGTNKFGSHVCFVESKSIHKKL